MKPMIDDASQILVAGCCGCGVYKVEMGAVSVRLTREALFALTESLVGLTDSIQGEDPQRNVQNPERPLRVLYADEKFLA